MKTEHPHDIHTKGLTYDKLEARCNKLYAARLKAEARRDEYMEALEVAFKYIDKNKCHKQILNRLEQIINNSK